MLDVPLLEMVGFAVAPAYARDEVKDVADYVTAAAGGHGAVREVVDIILKEQGKFEEVIAYFTQRQEN